MAALKPGSSAIRPGALIDTLRLARHLRPGAKGNGLTALLERYQLTETVTAWHLAASPTARYGTPSAPPCCWPCSSAVCPKPATSPSPDCATLLGTPATETTRAPPHDRHGQGRPRSWTSDN
jgi:hypothetical protein